MDDDVLCRAQVARALGITERTLSAWEKDLGLPSAKIGGRMIYIKADVLDWIRSNYGWDHGRGKKADAILERLKDE